MDTTTGTLTNFFFNDSTLSSPPLASVFVRGFDGAEYDFFAKGKLARQINREGIALLSNVEVTHEGHQITAIKELPNAE